MSDYGPRENWPETRASDMAQIHYDADQLRLRHEQFPALLITPAPFTLLDAARICCPDRALLARLERAEKIDRLKAELDQKAEELRALGDTPESLMTNEELDQMLDALNRQYHADTQAELGTESRAFPAKLNPHDE